MSLEDYTYKATSKSSRPGCWDILDVKIFYKGCPIGEYERGYHSVHYTFLPFMQRGGKEYALFSSDYTSTSVMRLPSCEVIAEEISDPYGFCPVDYYVPYEEDEGCNVVGNFGFVAGCVWGDDASWKIQFLDLRRIEDGIIVRDDRFGYIELGTDRLKDSISMHNYCELKDPKHPDTDWDRTVHIAIAASYHLSTNLQPTSSWLNYKPFGKRGMRGIKANE